MDFDADDGFAEGRREERRRYVERRAARTAVPGSPTKRPRKPWTVAEAKTALDRSLTVPEAALAIGRTASAVESLRQRWRQGRLPDLLTIHIPPPRTDPHRTEGER